MHLSTDTKNRTRSTVGTTYKNVLKTPMSLGPSGYGVEQGVKVRGVLTDARVHGGRAGLRVTARPSPGLSPRGVVPADPSGTTLRRGDGVKQRREESEIRRIKYSEDESVEDNYTTGLD